MGIFDKNIHMNGSRTTYQAFLDLADAAEEKGGTIGDRTVRLVKAGDYTAFVATATDLLFAIPPEIADDARGPGAGPRAKLFDDGVEASIDKSRELQNRNRDGLTKLQELAMGLEARHWSAATSCVMQLNQAVA